MKTILVPTDFSLTADSAIHYAFKLAELTDAAIILYHAFIPFESGFYSPEQSTKENLETENNILNRLSNIKDTLWKINNNVPVTFHVDRGPSGIRLRQFCTKTTMDLIVMGTTGASGIKEVVIGSFTAEIMTEAPCPVLSIPKDYHFKIPEKITFASDYLPNDIPAIKYLAELNTSFKSAITILHIDESDNPTVEEKLFQAFKQTMERQCEGIPLLFQHIAAPDIVNAILYILINDKTDILAMSPEKRAGFWNRLTNKSVTKTIVHQITIPLLSIPQP